MLRNMMLSKIHRATVTMRDLNYVGSITIDKKLMDAAGMYPNEKVEIYNISNGNRFATYVLEGDPGSGIIGLNGAAARLVSLGDKIIVVNYGMLDTDEAAVHTPRVIIVEDEENTRFYTYGE